MQISTADMIDGARSGIPIAIRRGDLDLLRTCLGSLWESPDSKYWLKWKAYSFVLEDAPYMAADLASLLAASPSKIEWTRFLYSLCLAPKLKDHIALKDFLRDKIFIRKLASKIPEVRNFVDFTHTAELDIDPSPYQQSVMDAIHARSKMGGKPSELDLCNPAYFIVGARKFDSDDTDRIIREGVKTWTDGHRAKPKTVPLPWYVFDSTTQAGLFAGNVFIKNHGEKLPFKIDFFWELWSYAETKHIPPQLLRVPESVRDDPEFYENRYYPCFLGRKFGISGMNTKQFAEFWNDYIVEPLQGCVEWCLRKRCERE